MVREQPKKRSGVQAICEAVHLYDSLELPMPQSSSAFQTFVWLKIIKLMCIYSDLSGIENSVLRILMRLFCVFLVLMYLYQST